MYAIPNGGKRGDDARSRMIEGNKLKRTGVKSGVPDIHLPVPARGFAGLYIEAKRPKSGRGAQGRTFDSQEKWHKALRRMGYCVVVCVGWESARDTVVEYLAETPFTPEDYKLLEDEK